MGQSSLWINMHRHAGQVARPDISLGPTGQEQGQQKTSQINMGNGCEGNRATSDPTAEGVVRTVERYAGAEQDREGRGFIFHLTSTLKGD